MSDNIVEFKTPAQLRAELTEREHELDIAKASLARISGVNEMLKIQILDLSDSLNSIVRQMNLVLDNLDKLSAKLPDLDNDK